MISIENLEPIMVYDLKRKRSPKTKPTSPDNVSHIQLALEASIGKIKPLLMRLKTLRKAKAIKSLSMFTAIDPILLLADSNASEVIVQKNAVRRAANSPR